MRGLLLALTLGVGSLLFAGAAAADSAGFTQGRVIESAADFSVLAPRDRIEPENRIVIRVRGMRAFPSSRLEGGPAGRGNGAQRSVNARRAVPPAVPPG